MSKVIKHVLASLFLGLTLFIFLVFLQNKITMTVHMHTSSQKTLQPQVYFADINGGYSETDSRKPFSIKNNHYHFSLPNLTEIHYMRFDPAKKKQEITLQKIIIVETNWFKKVTYEIPLDQVVPGAQVEGFMYTSKMITFSTTGNDPQLQLQFSLKTVSEVRQNHFLLLGISFLVWLLFSYLWHLYRNAQINDGFTAKIILYSLFFAFMIFKTVYYKDHVKFSYPPDEIAHLSYISYVQKNHHFIPEFEKMTMINNPEAGNYLSHPPLYYELMNLVSDESLSMRANVNNFRTLSMVIYILAFMLILYLGFSMQLGILADFSFLSVLTAIPMHAYIGASISNDNLAILGSIIFILGLKRLLEKEFVHSTYFLLSLGALIAYFSKLTAALLIFFAVLFFLFRMLILRDWIKISKSQWAILILALIPILYYQAYIMLHYHSLIPTFNVTHPEEYLKSPFFVPEEYRQHLSPMEWLQRMVQYIEGGWFGIHSHHSFVKNDWLGFVGLLLLHIFAVIALFFKCKEENKRSCLIGKLTLLALFAVLLVQYLFSYKAHLHSGYMGGLQPRYLLPFMFSFAIMSSIFVERFKNIFLFNIVIILICIQAIYSDFFYFLLYYI